VITKLPEMPKSLMSRFYGIYGQYIFYGLDGSENIDFARVKYHLIIRHYIISRDPQI
jgi:hypothetical protein